MKHLTLFAIVLLSASVSAQQRGQQPPAPGGGGRGGGGRGRGPIQTMTLRGPWQDGGMIPARYTQAGGEESPALEWANAPDGVTSFVLLVHDPDAAVGNGTDDTLHWLVWNIPGTQTSLPANATRSLSADVRQISATSPFYRGPGASGPQPAHHYVFELFALDTTIDVPAVGASPPQTRAAVVAAMAGHVRAKASYVGLFKRG
ncbi:MAG TPA: YbhB/YbcL family Raf kinase inhibitor-like protein [Vicinamibacterales bacterium]|nr:YbhB/YbcL family Raf kinase inhibitor-like protein [Vicinamibacterales bacterium]